MEQNKGFWYADWSFPIFVGLLSSGVFAGTHMYYLYGIGAFNEVAFVAMLKAGIDTGVYGAVAAFGASFLFARIIEGSLVGILDIGGAIQTGVGLGGLALLLGAGGVLAELMSDTVTLLLPVTRTDIEQALRRLRVWRLVEGYRGRCGDGAAVVRAIEAVIAFADAHRDRLEELDINPLRVLPERAVAVDALIRLRTA